MIGALHALWHRLRRESGGSAALEFALVAPVMAVLLLGAIELINVFRIQAKLNVAAGQLAEMVAGQATVIEGAGADKTGSLSDMCTGAAQNLLPFNPAAFSANIANLYSTSNLYYPTLSWESGTQCATTAPVNGWSVLMPLANQPRSLFTRDGTPYPTAPVVVGYAAVVVNVVYVYRNLLPLFLGPSVTFTAVAVARPRSNTSVVCMTAANAPCPQNFFGG